MFSISRNEPLKTDLSIAGYLNCNQQLIAQYQAIRQHSLDICSPLEIEDYVIQTVPEVSPPKWHLAHVSWFYETLILIPFLKNYKPFNSCYASLFNSYYDTIGKYHPRPRRGLLSRPTVNEVIQYRNYIDDAMLTLLSEHDQQEQPDIIERTILGMNHEQQHQELLLMDIKHIFACNPLRPVYKKQPGFVLQPQSSQKKWHEYAAGLVETGHNGEQFCYDNETPVHLSYLDPFKMADRLVTNGEYMEFIDDNGYRKADLWLSDAWKIINNESWSAPLYWEIQGENWWQMTLTGMQPVNPDAPVCHVSFYEAAAFARWSNKRLPTETEWEHVASQHSIAGNFRDSGILEPVPLQTSEPVNQLYGDVWEWTSSPYTAYPGYKRARGAFGEYNGKFMSSQMTLRGGAAITPVDHIRPTYRNFFYPHERWQYCGIRLAEDL